MSGADNMVHTFKGLSDQTLAWLDENGDTSTTRTMVHNAINQAQQMRLTETAWPFMLWDSPQTFTLVSGQQTYPLHQEFHRPLYFYNTTSKRQLIEVPVRNVVPDDPNLSDGSGQQQFTLWGKSPVQYHPTSASPISIVSTSSSDTGANYQIVIKGETASGIRAEAIYPNGTAAVSGAVSFTKILGVTKAQAWNGTLTMTSNSGAVTNLTLFDCEFGRSYQQLRFLLSPDATDTITYRFYRQPIALVNDFDIPDIPAPHSQILVWEALKFLYIYSGQYDGARMTAIQDAITRFDLGMRAAFLDATSLNAETRSVKYINRD